MRIISSPKTTIMVLLVATLGMLSVSATASEQALISTQTPTDRLYDVEMMGKMGYAVGEAGLVMKSTDGGETWNRENADTNLALTSIALTKKGAVAVGQLGEVVVNVGWKGWKQIGSDARMRLLGVDMNERGLAIAVGAFGTLMRSTDAGQSWELLRPDWAPLYDSGAGDTAVIRDEPTNYVVKVFADNRILIGGEYGQLLTSTDGGDTWEVTYRHPEKGDVIAPTLFDLKFYGDTGYATGQSGLVLISRDGGLSWQAKPTSTRASLFAIAGDADGNIFAIGQCVSIVSTDQGNTWREFEALDISLNWYAGLAVSERGSSRNIVAVGHSGRILSLNPFK